MQPQAYVEVNCSHVLEAMSDKTGGVVLKCEFSSLVERCLECEERLAKRKREREEERKKEAKREEEAAAEQRRIQEALMERERELSARFEEEERQERLERHQRIEAAQAAKVEAEKREKAKKKIVGGTSSTQLSKMQATAKRMFSPRVA